MVLIALHFGPKAFAQLTVTEATTTAEGAALIENVFVGSCVSVSNVQYLSNYSRAVGEFNNGNTTNIGIDNGIIMTSGRSNLAIGPNNTKCAERQNAGPSDADLVAIAGATIRDRTVLEFDFIPQNDTITFRYVFASEEYHEWVNAGYNDAFGFFISGPGIAGPYLNGAINIALIPGGATPVTIDNVNNGFAGPTSCGSAPVASSGPCTNCAYFTDNTGGATIQYDAFTHVLTAMAVVTPCQTYHIKLAVGDAGDQRYDSGVFFEAGSFSAGGGVTVEIETTTIPPGIYEGCADAWFIFRRVEGSDNSSAITANFTVTGTATPGVDYTTLPSSITIPAGQDSILVPISVALDFITEGNESIIVTLEEPPCACEAPGSATVNIIDNDIPLAVSTTGTTTICLGQSANLTANPSGSQSPYTSGWNNGAPVGNNVTVSPTNTTTYTYTVTDNCGGQTVSSSETITVIRPDFTVDDDEQCFDGNSFSFTNTGATGGSVTHLWNFGDGNTSNLENPTHAYASAGNYTVTHYIIYTASSCTANATASITVFPEPLITATVDQNVICTGGTDGQISTAVTGGTGPFNYLWSPGGQTSPSISNLPVGTYTVTVTDANGCTDSDSETIVQNDPIFPTALCQDITVQLNSSGFALISALDVDNGSFDNCSYLLSVSPAIFHCDDLGANTATLSVTDASNNESTCDATVTVEDNIAPTAICQNITVQLDGSGNATITAATVDNGSDDNCSVTLSATPLNFNCSNVGANSVTLTATDPSGNTDDCVAVVTIEDIIDPTAICQNITVQLDGSGNASITAAQVDNGSNDNCSVTLSASPNAFNCSNVGANSVTLTATDPSGNSANCSATVTVQDDVDPVANCQDITVQLNASGIVIISALDVNNGSSDNCNSIFLQVDVPIFHCNDIGPNPVTLTVTDDNGNESTCNAIVTVEDNIGPTAVCQNITVQLDGSGNASITAAQVDNGSNDNCSVVLSATPLSFTCANVGSNSVTLTATDPSGNTDNCTATVTVQDNVDPTAVCQNITVQLDGSGNASITAAQVDNGSNDNCSVTLSATPLSFNCSNVGSNTVTLTATDPTGNTDNCTATVTVEDDIDPTASCVDITVQLDATGNASIVSADIDGGSTDNCLGFTVSPSPNTFTCANLGVNTVTLTVTDASGNVSTCTADVTIEDNVDPTAVCQNITVQLNAAGNATIVAADVDGGSTDNCSVTISATPLTFNCSNVGVNNVTLTATDPSSNTDNCVAVVTVEDNVDPTALCQNATLSLTAGGTLIVFPADIDNGSNDACGISGMFANPAAFNCSNVGANTVTLTVTDNNGNQSTCTSTVTVVDDADPTAVCQNITVQLDGSGNASIVAADVDNGSNDNCSVTLSATPLSFNCSNTGANTVTLTATDPSGNTDQCTATVTVQDNVDPTAVCQNISVQLDGSGNASITAAQVDNGSNDNCSVTLSAAPLAFTCANVGANSVTLTATDPSGNTDDCTATVTVEDNIDPTAVCQNITVQLDANGDLTILSADIDGGSTDNCGIASLTIDGGNTSQDFDCSNVGSNTVTVTVTDVNGNVSTCDATVTVEDNVDPTAVCQNITVQLDGAGSLTITAADINNGSSDACGIATLTIDGGNLSQDFDCLDVGSTTVTLTVTDVNGNVSTCDATVTIEDNVDPSAVCQNITVQLDANGDASISTVDIDNGSSDNCGIASITLDGGAASLDFDCSDVGVQTVTLTVTDVNGNVSTCTADVTIEDTVDPTALCQNITIQLDANGDASISTVDIDNGSSDNCGIATITLDGGLANLDFDCSDVGVQTVTLTVTDVNGNVSTCNADVTIEDTVDPIALCQNITIQLDANGDASISTVDIDNGSSDNCGIASITLDGGATTLNFDCSDVGVNTVTLTVTDVQGNVSTCTADVTVEDNIDPTAVCQNITVQLDANGDLTILSADIDGGSADNCGIASITIDGGNTFQDFDCSNVGANTVTLTVTDVNGNVSTCDATVTVEDNVDPTAICQNITVQLDGTGNLSITSADIDNGSSDACGIATLTIDGGNLSQDFDCSDVGSTTVTLTVTDVNGNVSTCDATVTIEDNVDPTAVCQNITVQLDANGDLTIQSADIDGGSTDNCAIASLTIDGGNTSQDFDCTNVGANTITLTVTDVNGNVSTCDATVTIEDSVDPTAVCQNITVQLDATGNASISTTDINNGSSDNCGIASITLDGGASSLSFDCSDVGVQTVTLTVTDVNGNVSTCTADVTVEDNVDPTALCQNITIQLDASGNASIATTDIDNSSTDNCGIASITLDGGASNLNFDCSDVGVQTVTLTVTDVNGNVSTCIADVTVEDNVNPTAVCQNITVQLDATGNLTIVSADVDGGSTDNCGIASITLDGGNVSQDFDCSNVGANTVTLTVTDVNGNVSSCDATVTVEDNINPSAVCQNITVQLDANGELTLASLDVDGGSTDNCGIASITIDGGNVSQDFDCSSVGSNTITVTVTDVNGNVSTCDATVTVEDIIDPTTVCQNITVQLDASGSLTILATDIDGGSSDACGIASLTIDGGNASQDFDCSNVGANTVTLTVTDVNGNVSTCDATVTIEDTVDPTAICQDITVQLDASGNATVLATSIDNGSTDNCGIASITLDGNASSLDFDCSNVGLNTVTLTVTDVNGNVSTCTADITIEDNVDPTALCQNITVQLDASGNAVVTGADIDNGSTDNCGVASLDVSTGSFDCSNVGVNTVTLTVTDVNGNVSTCTADITIEDNVDPPAVCQNIMAQLDASGHISIVAADIDGGSTDNCSIASLAINNNSFDCNDLGNNLVTLTVTDVNGNVSTCTANVTVADTVAPTPVCIDIIAELSPAGTVTVAPGDVDNGSFDNCAIVDITLDPNTFNCSNVGLNTVTLTVTDNSGNTASCTAQVDVEDNVLPGAVCQDITVQLDASGNAVITPIMVDNGSSDACGSVTPTIVSPSSFDCSNVGVNIVTLTVEDQNGNISTCASTVTIEDTVDPIAVCQDITVQLDGTGNASIVPANVDGGSSDNCAIDNMTVSPNSFTCAEEGANTVTLTVTDVNGNVSTCTATVTVENNVTPTVSCQDVTVYLDGAGNASITASDVDGGSNAACGIASLVVDPSSFTCSNVGTNTVTLTGTDNSGNVSTCTATVTVLDTISPTAVCQNATIQLNASGNASIVAADINNGSADNCAIATLVASQTAFDCAEVGSNTVTLTVTDVNGNSSTCTASVTVEDNIDPTIICQNITVELDATGNITITGADIDNGTTDNCSTVGSTLTLDVSTGAFDCSNVGVNTVTLTATDENGNSSTCTADVTVQDNEAPIALCQNITVYLDAAGNVAITPAQVDNGSSDNCAIASMVVSPNSFTCSGIGANPVTLTVTDVNGNVASCVATVTVLDTVSPNAICQNITVQVDASGNASIVPSQVNNGSNDACGIASLVVDVSTFNCSVVGANTVILTVTDNNGNVSTCTSTVTVEDNVDPNAICQNVTVQLDANGDASITASQIDNNSTDNCAVASLDVNPSTFDCSNVGANTVTLTVTDVNGNTDNCTATVTVQDNVNPTAVCQNITVQLDVNGELTIASADIDGGSTDNCGIASLTIDGGNITQDFDCSNVGANTVTLTVTDVNGNVSTCDATVTVEDNVDPNAVCQNITVQLDANGELTITSADVDGGSNDNCGIASLTIDNGNTTQDFDCSNVGSNTVTLTVTDVNGNVSTCDATVTVEDNVDPTAICQNITVQLDANGELTITSADVDGGSTDNCGIASLSIDGGNTSQDFDCSNVGSNTVTLTVTDVNGNVSTCDATVTVEDNVDPNAICQNITIQLDANGQLTITSADIDGSSNDNCGIASLTIDGGNTSQDFDCSNVGANTVTLTVTDVNGNVSTCDATVTVVDNVDPNAICQDITVQLDANGLLTITSADVDGGSTDNCGIASLEIDNGNTTQDFDCANIGTNTVTLTVTDVNGNVSTCDATVTVQDTVTPTIVCQNITVQLDANGEATITGVDLDGGTTDNCGQPVDLTFSVDVTDFNCSNVGVNTVTLTATDANGNVSTCTADVTVEDNVDPTAVCQNITVQLDANGELTISSADIDGGSNDNCGIASFTIDGGNTTQDFDCSNVGANTVTLTVTDVNGNVSTCDATVTVEDNVDPTAVCQNITIQLDATGNATINSVDIDGGSTDNCGIASYTVDGGNTTFDFDCADEGDNTLTLTVTDVNGNVSTCTATVTVENNVAPNVFCQDITVYLDATGNISILADDVNGGSNASCGLASLTVSPNTFNCSNVGPNTVTLTAVDNSGNTSTCNATVTVLDTVSPIAVCQDITVQLDAAGNVTIVSADIDGGSNDNCGVASFEINSGNTSQDFDCSNVGSNTVTLTVTDVNGNVSTCDATVTVEDNVDPNAVCQNVTVQLDANGVLTITSADVDGGSNDNCGIASLTIDNGSTTQDFDCSNVGSNTVTLTVTDVNGNVSTCDATVIVEDNVDPNAICQDITVQLDANGQLTITSADVDGGSNDNCGIASLTIDGGNTSQDFDCSNVGTNTVTLTVTDVNGNVSTCDATVTVEDNVDPIAVCQDITVQLDANGELTITSADIDGGSNDNCGIASLTIDNGNTTQDFECSNVGANTVTLTVTDVNGNVSTCDATVTVEDNVDPNAICQDITIQLDATGTAIITAADIDGGSNDNCSIASLDIDAADTDWDCSQVGTHTVTLTVTDANGNVSTCDATVTVENNEVPTVSCQDITVYLNAAGNASITASDVNAGANASCGLASLTVSPNAFNCSNVGSNMVTLTATDNTGNVSTCTATVTVLDTISPTALCQNITVDLNASGNIVIDASALDAGSTDNCGVASVTVDSGQLNTTLDCSTVGSNTVTVTVTDVNGNASTCDATVTVEDNTIPTAACATVIIQLDANGEAIITPVLVDNGSNDNCGIATMSVLPQSLDCNNIGANSVVLTVTDVNGNISTCVATVTAEDTIAATPVCTDITVELTSNGTAVIAAGDVDNGSFDNCGIQSLSIDVTNFDCTNIGPNTVELTVIDVNGNVSTCTSTATVVDAVDPLLACQNITVYLDASGVISIAAADVDGGSTDNCGIDTMTVNPSDFTCAEIGLNQVTLTVTDLYGNADVCQASVTVLDTVAPTAICQNITVQLDATGNASIVVADVDGGSADACGIDAMSIDQTAFNCTQVGPNAVTLTVVDVNGNTSTCVATVTVENNVAPNANCQDITIYLSATGLASISAADVNAGSNASCGVDTVFVNPTDFTCANVGSNTVTLTVVDNNGNTSTCTANVTVLDTISPTALCNDLTVLLNNNGQGTITAAAVNNGSFDNCGVASVTIDQNTFNCAVAGDNTVTLTVSDVNGNVSTCTSTVSVLDTVSPNATCTPVVVQLDASGTVVLTTDQVDLNSSDNCTIASMTLDNDTFGCSDIGSNTVILTVTDASGNSSTCTATIIVEENVPPTTLCQDLTVYLDAAGNVSIAAADVDAGSTDNCAIDTMYVTPNAFTCSGVGANPVVLTVEDVNGNVSFCNGMVTVIDSVSPIAICQNITIQLDANGTASIVAEEIDNGSNDACGIASFTADVTSFDCSNVGANQVELTVTDVNGNTSNCTATVTIEDNVAPNAVCQDLTIQLDANGVATIAAADLDAGSTDNCAVDTLISSQYAFDCSNLGQNIITLTVTDVNGNLDNCSSVVTVLDTIVPTLVNCPMDTLIVPDSSNCSPQVFWVEPTADDNCTATISSNFIPGDNFPVGTTTVTYTATDQSGNSVSCSFDVTIEPTPLAVEPISPQGPCGYNLSCNGANDAEATAFPSGGCLPYTYLWSDGQTTQTATGLAAGFYTIVVTDANGNTASQFVQITEPAVLETDSLTSPQYEGGANVSCVGATDGSANINVSGGSQCEAYTFVWTGPNGFTSTDEDITGLGAGTYVVTVTDANGCSYSDSITLTEPQPLVVDSVVSDYNGFQISCAGENDGSIDLLVSGGAAPYTVAWNVPQTGTSIDSLTAGIYTYTVTDANGCTATGSITLTEPDGLGSDIAVSDYNGFNISCNGLSDGSVDLTPSDGTAPYTYLWSNNATTEDLSSVPAGDYTVTITDANGCQHTNSVTLTQPDSLIVFPVDTTPISCNGLLDGSFFVQATGGVPVLVYSWSDGQMGPTAEEIGAGSYVVTVTDINGCQDSIQLNMLEPQVLSATIVQQIDVTCFEADNAIVDVNVVGGTTPYTYAWSNGSTDQDLNGVAAGDYVLDVTDANGCSAQLTLTISQPELLIMTVDTVVNSTCSGTSDGAITVSATGGTAPYTYTWPALGQSGPSVTDLGAGVYEVQVVDANGCSWSLNVTVGQPNSIAAQVDVTSNVGCNGSADATAVVSAAGGTAPYSYQWSNSTTDSIATGFAAGTHSVTVFDANGCDTTLFFVITEPEVLDLTVTDLQAVVCYGAANGSAEVAATGGTEPYSISWSNNTNGPVADNLDAGSYTAYVSDANGCTDSVIVVITQPDTIELIQHSTNMVTCFGGNDGEITVLIDGGVAPYTYNWPAIGQTGNTATGLSAGWYTFIVADAGGCTYTDSIEITQPTQVVVTASADTAICPGNAVVISASASGGAGNYSYTWNNGLGFGASHSVSPSQATTYVVQAFDQSGCASQPDDVTVSIATVPTASFTSSSIAPCTLPADVSFTNTSTNATSYEWLLGNGQTSNVFEPTTTYATAGNYTVTLIATSGVGCADTATGVVAVSEVPVANFTIGNAQGCAPLLVSFDNGSGPGLTYFWDFGDGTSATIPNPTHFYEGPGDYTVSLIVSSPGGCSDTLELTGGVTAYPSPVADFSAQTITYPEPGSTYLFENYSVGATLYNWDFGNGDESDEFQPTYDFPNFGGFFVTLTSINEFGCADTAVQYLNVELQTHLYVPNAMGVGQEGEAGLFLPKGTGIAEYHVWVFDNWGNQLWESTALINGSPAEGWDGSYKGKYVPQGSYVWKINATFIDGEIWDGQEFSNGKKGNSGTVMVMY